MKFGMIFELELPKPWEPNKERNIFWEAMEQTILAEEMGFDYVWMVEHHFLSEFAHSSAPEVFLGALSQRTSKIRLGHGVVLLPVNHPIRVAESIATLDIMSNGRAEFGTGRSGTPYQLSPFGIDLKDSRPMWDEALHIIPRMWTEEVFSYKGTYYDIPPREIIPKPVQKPHPPMWVAASQVDTFQMAGERGIGALCFTVGAPGAMTARVEAYREGIKNAKPVGKFINNHVAGFSVAYCDENEKRGREICGEAGRWYLTKARTRYDNEWRGIDVASMPAEYKFHNPHAGGRGQLEISIEQSIKPEEMLDNGTFCGGNPDSVIRTVEKYEAAGMDQFLPLFQAGRIPHENIMKNIRLFGKYVVPHFQEKEKKAARAAGAAAKR